MRRTGRRAYDSVMRYLLGLVAVTLLLGGCASAPRATVLGPGQTSLALGGHPDDTYVAQRYAGRNAWPRAVHGFRAPEVTTYYEFRLDDQSFEEPGPGSFYSYRESYRAGAFVR